MGRATMIVQVDMGEGYDAVWNHMHSLFVPCKSEIAELGAAYEIAKSRFYAYASKVHDTQDVLSAEIYTLLMKAMDDAHKKLKPYRNQWWIARHGLGLN
jgi:hypothetical protein